MTRSRGRLLAGGVSLAAHAAAGLALLAAWTPPPVNLEPPAMSVTLAVLPPPPKPPAPPDPPKAPTPVKAAPTPAAAAHPAPRRIPVRLARTPPKDVAPLSVAAAGADDGADTVGETELAGAARAGGSGGGGGACDMPSRLQAALRKDGLVQAAVQAAHSSTTQAGRPILVWNGAWVRRRDQDGAGLAAVREAIMWEVAFSPKACRTEPVHGLVLLALNDQAGAPRLVMGARDWRWADLLGANPARLQR